MLCTTAGSASDSIFLASRRSAPFEWAEWLDHFDQRELLFVFEEQDIARVAARA